MLNFRLYKLYLSIFVLTGFLLVAGSKVVDNKNVSAVVTRVYDGDTFYIEVKDWPDIVGKNMPVRIYGIDCPELKSSDVTEHEYAIGQFRPYCHAMIVHTNGELNLTDNDLYSKVKSNFAEYRLFEVKMNNGKVRHFYILKDFIEDLNGVQMCIFLDKYGYLNKDWQYGVGAMS